MISVWHQSTARVVRKQRIRLLSYGSRGTVMSYTDHSAQRRFKSNTPIFSMLFFSPLTTLVVTCDLIWQCSLWQIGSDRQIVLPFSGRPRQMAPTALMTHNAGAEGRLLGNVPGVLLERCGDSAGSNSLFGASSWRTWPLPQELLPRVPPHWCHPV